MDGPKLCGGQLVYVCLDIWGGPGQSNETRRLPEFDIDIISVAVPYPMGSPEDVEQAFSLEEAVRGSENGQSSASEGEAVTIELLIDADPDKVLSDVNRCDCVTTFPQDAEEPQITLSSTVSVLLFCRVSSLCRVYMGLLSRHETA